MINYPIIERLAHIRLYRRFFADSPEPETRDYWLKLIAHEVNRIKKLRKDIERKNNEH